MPQQTAAAVEQSSSTRLPVVIQPIGQFIPIPSGDRFAKEMEESGYTLFQAGSIPTASNTVYSAYLFARLVFGEPIGADTYLVAFYSWDGLQNHYLDSMTPPQYAPGLKIYPAYYRLVNWDDPAGSMMGLARIDIPEPVVQDQLALHGHAADINQNGRPEFIFSGEYCPVECTTTIQGYDYFEITSEDEVIRLGADLSGRMDLIPISDEPRIFSFRNAFRFGRQTMIFVLGLAEGAENGFRDVSIERDTALLVLGAADLEALRSGNQEPLPTEQFQVTAYNVLLLYERVGRSQEGLKIFLEATELQNWSGLNERASCWLELARARAQAEFDAGQPFTVMPPLADFFPNDDLATLAAGLKNIELGLAACSRWMD